MPELDSGHPNLIYQMKAHIFDLHNVWRRFQIGAGSSLEDLRRAVLCLFGFREDFPYLITVGKVRYSEAWKWLPPGEKRKNSEEVDLAAVPLREVVEDMKIAKAHNRQNLVLYYEAPSYEDYVRLHGELSDEEDEYLLHARWGIVVTYEGVLPAQENQSYPVCIAGFRASPPKIIHSYYYYQWLINELKRIGRSRLTDALKRANDPDYNRYIPLLESGFDPAAFDIDSVNHCLLEIVKSSSVGRKLL